MTLQGPATGAQVQPDDPSGPDQAELEQLCEELYKATRTDPPRSVELGRAAVALARRSGAAQAMGLAARGLGHAWRAMADYRRALGAYASSDRAYQRAGLPVERARNAIGKLDALMYLGRYEEALAEAQQAERIFQEAGETLRLAVLRGNLGSLYYRLDRYADAAATYQNALPVFEAHGDEDWLANARLNLAIVKSSLQRFDEAEALYELALAFYRRAGMRVPEALIEYNLGCLDHIRARFSSALQRLQRAAQMLADKADRSLLASCRLEEAEVFLSLAMPQEAGRAAREAAHHFKALGMRYEQARCLGSEGVALSLGGQPRPALQALSAALALFRQEGNQYWAQLCRLHMAETYRRSGQAERAVVLARQALDLLQELGEPRAVALAAFVLGSALGYEGRRYLGKAIRGFLDVQAPGLAADALARLGLDLYREDRRGAALTCLKMSVELAESLRARLVEGSLRRHFHSTRAELYHWVARIEAEQGAPVLTSLHWTERGRARSLLEILEDKDFQGRGALRARAPESEAEDPRGELNSLYRQLDSRLWAHEGLKAEQGLRERITALETALGERELRRGDPLRLRPQDPRGSDAGSEAAALAAEMGEGFLFLEYFEANGSLGAIGLRGRRMHLVRDLCRTEEVAAGVRQLNLALATETGRFALLQAGNRTTAGDVPTIEDLEPELRRLYARLVEPFVEPLGLAENLILSPSGVVAYVPFCALQAPQGPLVEQSSISLTPSLAVYRRFRALARRPPLPADAPALLVGYGPDLPEVEREVRQVARQLGPSVRLGIGAGATRQLVLAEAPTARLLHLATHGLFRRDHPLFSSLLLADGRLSFYDVFRMQLQCRLVVLSACETGRSDESPGEELIGLSGGFLQAGAQAVVVSLWNVLDSSSAMFMERFYARLGVGSTAGAALAEAMRDVRARLPHPLHWAPYILVGDPEVRLQSNGAGIASG